VTVCAPGAAKVNVEHGAGAGGGGATAAGGPLWLGALGASEVPGGPGVGAIGVVAGAGLLELGAVPAASGAEGWADTLGLSVPSAGVSEFDGGGELVSKAGCAAVVLAAEPHPTVSATSAAASAARGRLLAGISVF
jgi:hypothetical protein